MKYTQHPSSSLNSLLHIQERTGCNLPVLLKETVYNILSCSILKLVQYEYAISRELAILSGLQPVFAMECTESQPVRPIEYLEGVSSANLL